ncbi:hypothetical protein RJ640_008649 [Escallonia rubra]|uniref:Glycosyl transferase family 1 domain-containing protein n=1 Tax=Escallonia rubra TaxID=112253 RepID=A0AA88UH91_9ASTE|nr:hypothetical protein RJ640_008649 [Escallonia rubra]
MEEGNRNIGRQLKSTLSGRSTPRNSPSFRRASSGRTPRREGRISGFNVQWFRSNRIVLWLLLITLWCYAGFYVQSRWAHGDNKEGIFGSGSEPTHESSTSGQVRRRDLVANNDSLPVKNGLNKNQTDSDNMDVVLVNKENGVPSRKSAPVKKKKGKRQGRNSPKKTRGKPKTAVETQVREIDVQEEEIPKRNTSYGMLVGPFGSIEDSILEWSPEKRSGTCDRKGQFARLVWSRKFVLIFHELSMTGAPLSMMELATELLSCGATVSVVVLSKKGGLMPELNRRKIRVLEDKEKISFKAAMKADLVIAGSAVCSSWIEQYLEHSMAGASRQLVWWIMENRREYFDRSKPFLNRVKMLIFLSESQSKQWLAWCEEENLKLPSQPEVVPLSVNDEVAFVAGIACSLNTPAFSTEKMLEKRYLLRDSVRKEMGLTDNDMLVTSLSSINPGKGHFLLLESARLMIEQDPSPSDFGIGSMAEKGEDYHSRALLQKWNRVGESSSGLHFSGRTSEGSSRPEVKYLGMPHVFDSKRDPSVATFANNANTRKLFSDSEVKQKQTLKVLIGSVGSKSNKVPYVKAVLKFLSLHSNLSKAVLWTPATTRVASLYAASDAYIINSQGIGETFGRVTIEAMAFGLPVLGTDAGGTKEIVEHNVSGLLHPLGRPGSRVLSKNLQFLLENPSVRQQMGMRGREKVEKMYLKKHLYKKLGEVLFKSMRIK